MTPNLKLAAVPPRLQLNFSTFWVWFQISKFLYQTTSVLRDFCLPDRYLLSLSVLLGKTLLKNSLTGNPPHLIPVNLPLVMGHMNSVQRETACCLLPTFNHPNSNRPSRAGQSKYLLGTTIRTTAAELLLEALLREWCWCWWLRLPP